MGEPDVRYEVDGHVGLVTLNRPEVHNALRRRTYDELTELVRTTAARVLVITGAGRSFCSGDDVRELMRGGEGAPPRPAPRLTPVAGALLSTDVPVIAAERAERIGLVGRVVDDEQLLPTAVERARTIAANPPLAVAALKRGLRRALDPDWTDPGTWVSSTLGELFTTEDHREDVRSFLEKREPRYVGR